MCEGEMGEDAMEIREIEKEVTNELTAPYVADICIAVTRARAEGIPLARIAVLLVGSKKRDYEAFAQTMRDMSSAIWAIGVLPEGRGFALGITRAGMADVLPHLVGAFASRMVAMMNATPAQHVPVVVMVNDDVIVAPFSFLFEPPSGALLS